jgi:hypothetical protein
MTKTAHAASKIADTVKLNPMLAALAGTAATANAIPPDSEPPQKAPQHDTSSAVQTRCSNT